MFKKLLLLFSLFCLFTAGLSAQIVAAQPSPSVDKTVLLRREAFEKVWTIINEKHFDPTFGGVDWKKMREIYEPKAFAAKNSAEFHSVLQQMLDELGQSHFNIVPLEAVIEDETDAGGSGRIGVELKLIDGKAVVRRVKNDSPAAKAGVKTGFVVEKIGGKTIAEILAPLDVVLAARRETEAQKNHTRERVLQRALSGKPESNAALEVFDEKNERRQFSIKRETEKAEYSLPIGNFPPQAVEFEARRLEKQVGYIRFNIWVMPQLAKIREAIKTMSDAPGIIFDLRGNPGGLGVLAAGIAGNLVSEQTSLGSLKFRAAEQKFLAYPQTDAYKGKIVILTDGGSASTSEIFAAGLQESGRARVVGETSMGAVLASIFDRLPTNAIFQYAISDYKSPKNILIEGRGVKPDMEVRLTRETLLEGRDLQIEAAVAEILK